MKVEPVIDYYLVLGVPRDASFSQISDAYERLRSRFAEEDRGHGAYSQDLLRLNEAYLKLRTPQNRTYYDSQLVFYETHGKRDARAAPAPVPAPSGRSMNPPLPGNRGRPSQPPGHISTKPVIWKMISEEELRSLAEGGRPYNLDKLLSISASALYPMRSRTLAGGLAVEEYNKLGFAFMLFGIATDIGFPEEVRRLAGTRAVALYERCARGCEKDAPESVAPEASDAADMLLCMADPFLYNRNTVPGGRDERSFVEAYVPMVDDVRESAALAAARSLIHQKRIVRCAWLLSKARKWFRPLLADHLARMINQAEQEPKVNEAKIDVKRAVAAFGIIHDPQRYSECIGILNKRAKRSERDSVRPSERRLPEARQVYFCPRK